MVDILDLSRQLIENNWDSDNVNQIIPIINLTSQVKRISRESILLYEINDQPEDNASGAATKRETWTIGIKLYAFRDRDTYTKMRTELRRIFDSKQLNVFLTEDSTNPVQISDVIEDRDLTENTTNFWQAKIMIRFNTESITI